MTAPDAAPEPERKPDNKHPIHDRELGAQPEHDDDNITVHATGVPIKAGDDVLLPTDDVAAQHTETSLRSNPAPSSKRRESAAAETAQTSDHGERPQKRRKRGVSPPWQFPSVDGGTATTADGRRISTRVNTATPVVSESEGGRARSISLSQSASRSRPASPPWKRFQAEGPSSLQVDGKRKSGRVNKELSHAPTRVSPRSKRTVDKMAVDSKSSIQPMPRGKPAAQLDGAVDVRPKTSSSTARRSQSPASRIAELQTRIAALQPVRSFPSPDSSEKQTKATHKPESKSDSTARVASPSSTRRLQQPSVTAPSPDVVRPSPRIKLKLRTAKLPFLPPPHPHAHPLPPVRPPQLSLYQIIEDLELQEMQQPYMENDRGPPNLDWFKQRNERQAAEEGSMRRRLLEAKEPGGALSKEVCSLFHEEQQKEPEKLYAHHDHLFTHALHLRHLQVKEKANHKAQAKKLAYEALEAWKAMRGPTEEDLIVEQDKIFKLIYKQVVFDMRGKWTLVTDHVKQLRNEQWVLEDKAQADEKLEKKLKYANSLFAKQRRPDQDGGSDEEMEDGNVSSEVEEEDEDVEEREENMSDSGDEEAEEGEMSEEALAEYLRMRDAEPPDKDAQDVEMEEEPDGEEEPKSDRIWTLPATEDIFMADVIVDDAILDKVNAPDVGLGEPSTGQAAPPVSETLREREVEGVDQAEEDEEDQAEYHPETVSVDFQAPRHSRHSVSDVVTAEQQAVEAELSEDESVEMDSDDNMSTGDEAQTGSRDSGDDEESGNDEGDVRLAMFCDVLYGGKKEVGLPTPTTSAEGDARDRTAEPSSQDVVGAQAAGGAMEGERMVKEEDKRHPAVIEKQQSVPVPMQHYATPQPIDSATPTFAACSPSPTVSSDPVTRPLVPIPALLRGTLRSYQHAGVDWLASLHRAGTNGILADEMGLGKTIQTISLLAHLAEEHGIWETHLVIVPTSVILNWVTEFQKFLPGFRVLGYYGSADDRARLRKGWVNDPHHEDRSKRGFNVVITSYNVAMQDINAIRNVQWHYLVLDEAHNIRNFNSQRFQVLIRLKTKARLLLTGTPLQNSLSELWSLLTFLTAGDDNPAHGDLAEFLGNWKDPVKEIFDRGVSALSEKAQSVVDKLHVSLRPFLLRRLKSEVEKDLPKKTERVVVCKLSKRQRQLYQEYMGLASTRESLTRGNAVSAGRVLLALRRVCNHPDLFDPRPIQTSFAMEKGVVEGFGNEVKVVRTLLGEREGISGGLMMVAREQQGRMAVKRSRELAANAHLRQQIWVAEKQVTDARTASTTMDLGTMAGSVVLRRVRQRERALQHLRSCLRLTETCTTNAPIYGSDLRELLTVRHDKPYTFAKRGPQSLKLLRGWLVFGKRPLQLEHSSDWLLAKSTALQRDVLSIDKLGENMHDIITRFAFCTPVATAAVLDQTIPPASQELIRASSAYPRETDFAHEARARTSIVFPDSRLLVFDSGKLQRLAKLLRELQAKGSRSLIFTQMTGTLNILEQFLNLLGLPYLRLDGSTPVEKRQIYAAEFNRVDSKYQCMILSSRAGGVGLNLTGASSVVFYDLDWNPQMDRQCMDRAHRIGQMRDVEVFKMVSEKTVEENILRRANQKSLLDQAVIQEGHFTTEYQQPEQTEEDGDDDVNAAIARYLGGGDKGVNAAVESVEEKEDVVAAQNARKEDMQDEADFAERSSKGPSLAATPGPQTGGDVDEHAKGHVDAWMVALVEMLWKDVPFVPPVARKLDRHGRDPSHRPKRKR
ncbi:hypothetical protein LTR08_002390 [Meristemomyces frigidus]|nr:hypothetical protein LTR08_002390 [Meristemomyces frigidus]